MMQFQIVKHNILNNWSWMTNKFKIFKKLSFVSIFPLARKITPYIKIIINANQYLWWNCIMISAEFTDNASSLPHQ